MPNDIVSRYQIIPSGGYCLDREPYNSGMKIEDQIRFESKFIKSDGDQCWFWLGHLTNGYGRFTLNYKSCKAYRLSHELYIGPIPEGMHVLHKCDVRHCVNPSHLFLGTNQDNIADRQAKNRQAKGENQGQAKLTEEQVIAIRADTRPIRTIGKDYGISHPTVLMIQSRRTWKHVK